MDKKNILIVGINGFLGSKLAELLKSEYNIIGLERNTQNLTRLQGENYPVYEVGKDGLKSLFLEQNIHIIIYAATLYGRNGESDIELIQANLLNPLELLDKAIKNKVKYFINTDTVLDRYTSTYALTKKQFMDWLKHRKNKINVINMPLEHFYGPECPETNFISLMTKRLIQNEPIINLTKGEPLRNFVYFTDVLMAYKIILEKLPDLSENYYEFEVSTNELTSIKDIMLTLKELTDSSTRLNFGALPYRPNEIMKSEVNNSALLALGWQPEVNVEDGLKMIVSHLKIKFI